MSAISSECESHPANQSLGVVRRGAGIAGAADLKGRRVSLGRPNSGDLAMSLMLLDHLGLNADSDIEARTDLDYADIERLLQNGELDAALLAVGVQADVYRKLAEIGECEFLGIPNIDALQKLLDEVTTLRQEALSEFTAHQLDDDRGPECFIHMCHALSDKINAKLTRQQESKLIGDLIAAVEGRSDGPLKMSS